MQSFFISLLYCATLAFAVASYNVDTLFNGGWDCWMCSRWIILISCQCIFLFFFAKSGLDPQMYSILHIDLKCAQRTGPVYETHHGIIYCMHVCGLSVSGCRPDFTVFVLTACGRMIINNLISKASPTHCNDLHPSIRDTYERKKAAWKKKRLFVLIFV